VNWTGLLFGLAAMVAVLGGAAAAFLRDALRAVAALAVAMMGVAGMCLALGNDFLAIVIAFVLASAVPAAALVAALLAPPPVPDARRGAWSVGRAAIVAAAVWAALGLVLVRAGWPVAGGRRETGAAWVGFRLLSDDLSVLVAAAALLALSSLGAVALLRARRARVRRSERERAP
jgi:NADH:ubiquinone oxidoreductase subunit 6 (subunit J)